MGQKLTITSAENAELSRVLQSGMAGHTKGAIIRLIKDRNVKVDGVRVSSDVAVKKGQLIEVFVPTSVKPLSVGVIYADGDIVVVDKPKHAESERAVPMALKAEYGELIAVHRLDTNTTGIVVYARNAAAQSALEKAFREHSVRKTYIATVVGKMPQSRGTLRCYLVKDDQNGIVKAADKPVRGATEAVTDYEVLAEYGELSDVALYPVTGRTHQLRVQLARIGCPILGDSKYGDYAANKKYGKREQELRAVGLKFLRLGNGLERLSGKEFKTEKKHL